MLIGIGIDTGGTYTDAVVYDCAAKRIVAGAKALTTKRDLSVGILEALDKLPAALVRQAGFVALSTTLATNACVEGKYGRAKLVFIGGDPETVDMRGADYGLPPAADIWMPECHGNIYGEILRPPDWERFRAAARRETAGLDGVGVVEMFAMRNGAVVEKEAKRVLGEETDIPVVCGHELSSELNSLQRGASALLNAALFPVIADFIAAMRRSMAQRELSAPMVVVRSDGSLMGAELASVRPVETLLCGPAASVMGCVELTNEPNAVVVDMGGTTTDIAIIRDGVPSKAVNGIGIGKWRTFVDGLSIHTFGLGGDSAVRYADRRPYLEERRVVPLCIAADEHPSIMEQLSELIEDTPKHSMFLHEFFILAKDVSGENRYSEEERRFAAALSAGPLIRRKAAAAVGWDEYATLAERLIREGAVQVAGLTPTDVMHLKGDFTRYRTDASRLGARFVASNLDVSVEELCGMVYEEVKRKLYLNVVKALLMNEDERYRLHGVDVGAERMILDGFRDARRGRSRGLLARRFVTDLALIGIGAPVHIFLPDVAEMLGARAVIPECSGVANAVGAVAGKVHAGHEIIVRPKFNLEGITGYTVFGNDGNREFAEREEAEAFARAEAERGARAEAIRRGAAGEITVTSGLGVSNTVVMNSDLYLGSKAVAHAIGAIRF